MRFAHDYYPETQKLETGRSEGQGHSELHIKFKASQIHGRLSKKKKKKTASVFLEVRVNFTSFIKSGKGLIGLSRSRCGNISISMAVRNSTVSCTTCLDPFHTLPLASTEPCT